MNVETERLRLRQWQQSDRDPFAELNADKEVMAYFPSVLSKIQSNQFVDKQWAIIEEQGWGLWALELKHNGQFLGFTGLSRQHGLPFKPSPCIEIGWRLAKSHWGNGYATEAAKASLKFAFEQLDLDQVVSFTALENWRSRAVMERIGMFNTNETFLHPKVPPNHKLQEHCLYKINK